MEVQKIRISDEISIEATANKTYGLLINNENAAKGFACEIDLVRKHKSNKKDQLLENKHWVSHEVQTKGGKQKVNHWTLRGVMRLQLYIQSEQANMFGSWAESAIFDNISIDVVGREDLLRKEAGLKSKVKTQQEKVDKLGEVIELNQMKKELKDVRAKKSKMDAQFMQGILDTWKQAGIKEE